MSTLGEVLDAAKKVLLVVDDIKRLSHAVDTLSEKVTDHERRLIRIETIIEVGGIRTRRTLSGK